MKPLILLLPVEGMRIGAPTGISGTKNLVGACVALRAARAASSLALPAAAAAASPPLPPRTPSSVV